jgi:hypothetical protein
MTSLTEALPLIDGIDNQLCFLLVDYMINDNVWTKQVFQSAQYGYVKDDLASKQRASVFCYPMRSRKNSFAFSQKGMVVMELHFSLQKQRTELAKNVIQIANLIQLMNLNNDFTKYCQLHMPGLFWIGKECNADYSRVYAKECVVKIEFDYNVDLLAYQRGLQMNGYDIISPDEMIYNLAQSLIEEVVILDKDLQPIINTNT